MVSRRKVKAAIEEVETVLYNVGVVLLVISGVFLIPTIVAGVYGEWEALISFLIAAAVSFGWGALFYKFFKAKEELRLHDAMVLTALVWLVVAIIGTIPYLYSGVFLHFVDAFFESMSGWSTTGLTLIAQPEACLRSIIFWRSFNQYVGGAGFIVISLTAIVESGPARRRLYLAEARGIRLRPSIVGTTRRILWIYLLYAVIGAGLYYAAGMGFYDAVCHAFTSLSTGGFSTWSASIGSVNNIWIEIVACVLMVLGATSFAVHYEILNGNIKEFFKNIEVRAGIGIFMAAFVAGATYTTFVRMFPSVTIFFRKYVFQIISALTTTGYMTITPETLSGVWLPLPLIVLIILMVIGGCSCATAGGIKLIRIGELLKAIGWRIREITSPTEAVLPFKVHEIRDKVLSERHFRIISTFIAAYVLVLLVSIGIVTSYGYPLTKAVFDTASALGTVGLSTGLTNINLPTGIKLLYAFDMYIGRLEIWAVFLFIYECFKSVGRLHWLTSLLAG